MQCKVHKHQCPQRQQRQTCIHGQMHALHATAGPILVSASSCDDCNSSTRDVTQRVIFQHFSPHVTYSVLLPIIALLSFDFHSSAMNSISMVLLWASERKLPHCLILCPAEMLLNLTPDPVPLFTRSVSLMEDSWYTSNTTSTLSLLSPPSLITIFSADLAKSWNVVPLPSNFCIMLIASTMQADWSGIVSATGTFCVVSFMNFALSVFLSDPSPLANAHGIGPSGWLRTCFISIALLWATTIMCPNKFLSAFSTISLRLHLTFLVCRSQNVFNFCFLIVAKMSDRLASSFSRRFILNSWYAASPILELFTRSLAMSVVAIAADARLTRLSWSSRKGLIQLLSIRLTNAWTSAISFIIFVGCKSGWSNFEPQALPSLWAAWGKCFCTQHWDSTSVLHHVSC